MQLSTARHLSIVASFGPRGVIIRKPLGGRYRGSMHTGADLLRFVWTTAVAASFDIFRSTHYAPDTLTHTQFGDGRDWPGRALRAALPLMSIALWWPECFVTLDDLPCMNLAVEPLSSNCDPNRVTCRQLRISRAGKSGPFSGRAWRTRPARSSRISARLVFRSGEFDFKPPPVLSPPHAGAGATVRACRLYSAVGSRGN